MSGTENGMDAASPPASPPKKVHKSLGKCEFVKQEVSVLAINQQFPEGIRECTEYIAKDTRMHQLWEDGLYIGCAWAQANVWEGG